MNTKQSKSFGLYAIIIVFIVLGLLAFTFFSPSPQEEPFTYRHLIEELQRQNFGRISNSPSTPFILERSDVVSNSGVARFTLVGSTRVRTVDIVDVSAFMEIYHDAIDRGLYTDTNNPAGQSIFAAMFFPLLIMVGSIFLLFFLFQHLQGGGGGGNRVMNFGKSRAKAVVDDKKKKTFDDVAGMMEEKEELVELVEFLKNPKKFVDIGARIPKGVLLVGPPGTGKTLLAKACAGEAGVPFFSISGSDFVEMFVGVGASRVRDLFEQAKKNSPAIVFIDEIDAVGRKRGAGLGGGHDEREQTLNQLLVEMDGFGINEGVIIVAATNRADILDPALLRPGRFDRRVNVSLPDVKGREEILHVHAKGKKFAKEVEFKTLAQTTPGFSGAELENLLNEAAILTARDNKSEITMDDIRKAYIKVGFGTERRSRVISPRERKLTAYHEAGHAIMQEMLDHLDHVHIISIIPTGAAGGYTSWIPSEAGDYKTKRYFEQQIVSLMGGRAAEQLVMGDISTGASGDINQATNMARNMVTRFGMSDVVGPIQYGDSSQEVFIGRDMAQARNYSEDMAKVIDEEIKRIIHTGQETAIRILNENMDVMHRTAELLIEKEKITGSEFRKLFTRKMPVKINAVNEATAKELGLDEETIVNED